MASALGAKISLFHVIEPVATYVPVGASIDVISGSPPELEEDQTAVSVERLEKLAGPAKARGVDVDCDVVVGMAVDEIVERARTLGARLVVLGSHGHGALFHLFSGSVVTGVLKRSPAPVLVVPVRD